MNIHHAARAGTYESSDIFVLVLPGEGGIKISLTSSVEKQFGNSIRATIHQVLEEMGVTDITIEATDHGALDCTIRARVETAVERAAR